MGGACHKTTLIAKQILVLGGNDFNTKIHFHDFWLLFKRFEPKVYNIILLASLLGVSMHIVRMVGSPRKGMNTDFLVQTVRNRCESKEAHT